MTSNGYVSNGTRHALTVALVNSGPKWQLKQLPPAKPGSAGVMNRFSPCCAEKLIAVRSPSWNRSGRARGAARHAAVPEIRRT